MMRGWERRSREERLREIELATGADPAMARMVEAIETGRIYGDAVALGEDGRPVPRPRRSIAELR